MSDSPQDPTWFQASDGKWYPPQPSTPAPVGGYPGRGIVKTSGLAIASLTMGIISLVGCLPLGIGGLITGIMAKRAIRDAEGAEKGDGLAVGGIVTSAIGIALWGLVLLALVAVTFLGQSASSKFSAVGVAVDGA